ncbi:uncharacterized protein N7483_011048 [Penicillium malachiteum]|uniref:uncharacterized protein n=1 Tax=Penicillium malachiteum TaxID=1324776 RepID=UPI0025472D00|nr:uncharacterized protein N7483_011048 [Penicillium malachiteum]KAJ5713867.1 hypothetical protein N7483_011048 [Penicillium malachiteum]
MEDYYYKYNILTDDFDPDAVFPEILTLKDQLSNIIFEDYILECLTAMIYGSNMIEDAGCSLDVTSEFCKSIFSGQDSSKYENHGGLCSEIEDYLSQNNRPKELADIQRCRRETVQHANAASYIISKLYLEDQDLSEEIILKTHGVLTCGVDADSTPWTQYSGVYRTDEVRAGLHSFPHHILVPSKMKAMIRDLKPDLKTATKMGAIDQIAIAAKYAHIFVNIHPFLDGNGRMCRLILNALLLKLGSFLVCIGETEDDRAIYLEIAAKGGSLESFYESHDDEDKPVICGELGSFVMSHVKKSMQALVTATDF